MLCETVKPTIITETNRENVSYPSNCFYFTCIFKILYILFFKVLYLFVKIVQHKQDTRKRRGKTTFFKIRKKPPKNKQT